MPRAGRIVTYVTLCCDLVIMVVPDRQAAVGGGLQSPLLATQLLFTTLFAILFPKPLAILPPLLALPITTRLDQLLNRSRRPRSRCSPCSGTSRSTSSSSTCSCT